MNELFKGHMIAPFEVKKKKRKDTDMIQMIEFQSKRPVITTISLQSSLFFVSRSSMGCVASLGIRYLHDL
jgi:hypothetical protein